ncbi:MAG: hypothetical protein R2695_16120 [Acidimicrobiales bacterium]
MLSNNVGVLSQTALLEADDTEWAWVIEFVLLWWCRGCRVVVPRMQAHGQGVMWSTPCRWLPWWRHALPTWGVCISGSTPRPSTPSSASPRRFGENWSPTASVCRLCPGMVDSNLAATSMRNRPDRYGGPVAAADTTGLLPRDAPGGGRPVRRGGDRSGPAPHPDPPRDRADGRGPGPGTGRGLRVLRRSRRRRRDRLSAVSS